MKNNKDNFSSTLIIVLIAAHYGLFTSFKEEAIKAQTGSSLTGFLIALVIFPISYFLFKKNVSKSIQYSITAGLIINLLINLVLIYLES